MPKICYKVIIGTLVFKFEDPSTATTFAAIAKNYITTGEEVKIFLE